MRKQTLTGFALALALTAGAAYADESDLAAATPDMKVPEMSSGMNLDSSDAPKIKIGDLEWHTNYTAAYKQARDERKMLFLFFRDEQKPQLGDIYLNDVLTNADLYEPLSDVVRVVLSVETERPLRIPEEPGLTLLSHSAFKFMYGRQGIAVIDLTDPESDLYGHVVSAHPFSPGKHYTTRGTKLVLGLPTGTVTQRALIYAVRLHPAAPVSTTDGKCHGFLCEQARQSSKLMATYEAVGHHDWGFRSGEIAVKTGKSAQEVAAVSGNRSLIDAAIEVVDMWYGSPAHWSIMSSPATIFGYDLVRAPSGNWYGTGIFAY